ncbi:acetaldehyde dehydrogenase (acetylating) [Niallia sp. JL1B1071]|uniref:Acetaldehyde dehydrogenase (Acetylating) n=1 Tax=Niallia hominis TaxID=3133173 RepID=A0ABV1EY68_9BACI
MLEFDKDLRSIQETRRVIEAAKKAQKELAKMTQEQINRIVEKMYHRAYEQADYLAKLAYEETGFGKIEDKIIKNKFASQTVYESIKDMKTIGLLKEDKEQKVIEVAVPMGVVAGLIPSTNPTSTTIYKALIAIKAGNAIVFSPHPGAKKAILETVKILKSAALEAGAPDGVVGTLSILTMQGTSELMKHRDIAIILATGGEAMVRAAYSSGNPAIGVGPGNGPAFIERTADIPDAVSKIIDSKTFDNGVICASEQSIVVERLIADQVVSEFKRQGAYFLSSEESEKLSGLILRANGTMNPAIVGKSAVKLAQLAGFYVPEQTTVLISQQKTANKSNPYAREKLCPILAFYVEEDWLSACDRCIELLEVEGKGHTLCIHSKDDAVIREFALRKPVSRMLINAPGALGGIGGATNIAPALTLGCGAVGGSSTSDNITPMNLVNIRKAAYGVRSLAEIRQSYGETVSSNSSEITSVPADMSDTQVRELIQLAIAKLQTN